METVGILSKASGLVEDSIAKSRSRKTITAKLIQLTEDENQQESEEKENVPF